jgi:predicted SAM-dependent methyltransferase
VRLNLACGDDYRPGYINLDLRGGDLFADVGNLPFRGNTAYEIVAQDILEHIPAARTEAVLQEWYRVLEPNGVLNVRVPDLHVCALGILGYEGGSWTTEQWIEHIYGGHRWGPDGAWDTHHTGWTHGLLHNTLETIGFEVVTWDQGNPDFYTTARRP